MSSFKMSLLLLLTMMITIMLYVAWYSIVYNDLSCNEKKGTFGTLELIENHEVDAVFGGLCSTGAQWRRVGALLPAREETDSMKSQYSTV